MSVEVDRRRRRQRERVGRVDRADRHRLDGRIETWNTATPAASVTALAGLIVELPLAWSSTVEPDTAPPWTFRSVTLTIALRPPPARTAVGDAETVDVRPLAAPPVGAANERTRLGWGVTVMPSSTASAASAICVCADRRSVKVAAPLESVIAWARSVDGSGLPPVTVAPISFTSRPLTGSPPAVRSATVTVVLTPAGTETGDAEIEDSAASAGGENDTVAVFVSVIPVVSSYAVYVIVSSCVSTIRNETRPVLSVVPLANAKEVLFAPSPLRCECPPFAATDTCCPPTGIPLRSTRYTVTVAKWAPSSTTFDGVAFTPDLASLGTWLLNWMVVPPKVVAAVGTRAESVTVSAVASATRNVATPWASAIELTAVTVALPPASSRTRSPGIGSPPRSRSVTVTRDELVPSFGSATGLAAIEDVEASGTRA